MDRKKEKGKWGRESMRTGGEIGMGGVWMGLGEQEVRWREGRGNGSDRRADGRRIII